MRPRRSPRASRARTARGVMPSRVAASVAEIIMGASIRGVLQLDNTVLAAVPQFCATRRPFFGDRRHVLSVCTVVGGGDRQGASARGPEAGKGFRVT